MKILLLGATGLLGRNVLNILLDKGFDVVALVRKTHGISDIDSSHLSIVTGSLTDIESLRCAAVGCQAIINCAGTTDMSLLRYEDYLPMNTDLCGLLVDTMENCGVKILVHVSTANTIGFGTSEMPADESAVMCEPFASSYYACSKRQGERLLEKAAKKHPEWHIVILNPGFMVGPWDSKPSSGRLLMAAYHRPLMMAPSGGKSFVDVRDVAASTVAALSKGRNGERYLLTGEDLPISLFYRRQAAVCGYRQLLMVLPDWMLFVAGAVGDLLRFFRIPTQLSSNNVRQLSVMEYYTSGKASKELDFIPSSTDDAIRDFFDWQKTKKCSR